MGRSACQLSVKISLLCRLPVEIFVGKSQQIVLLLVGNFPRFVVIQ